MGASLVVSAVVAAVSIVLWGGIPISEPGGARLFVVLTFEMLLWGNVGTWLLLRRHERRLFSNPRPGVDPEEQASRFAVRCGVAALVTELTMVVVVSLPLALHAHGYERRQERRYPDRLPLTLPDPERPRKLGAAALVVYGLMLAFMGAADGSNG